MKSVIYEKLACNNDETMSKHCSPQIQHLDITKACLQLLKTSNSSTNRSADLYVSYIVYLYQDT